MSEYINRNELLKTVNESPAEAHNERCAQLIEAILYAPTADVVEVVHAYWQETNHITESKSGREIHCLLGFSIGGKLTWDGKTIMEESDCGLIFLHLNEVMLNRMIQLGFPSGGK